MHSIFLHLEQTYCFSFFFGFILEIYGEIPLHWLLKGSRIFCLTLPVNDLHPSFGKHVTVLVGFLRQEDPFMET